jgi:adenylate cyclase, class 2
MSFINIEIKARTNNTAPIRDYLLQSGATSKGTDQQVDTYFNVPKGRLKLRQGNIENSLIYYERDDLAGPKQSNFNLVSVPDGGTLLLLLTNSLGIKVQVKKNRDIYYIKNVKFHIDELPDLGNFIEIEASNQPQGYRQLNAQQLREQCEFYVKVLEIQDEHMIQHSYSDMLLSLRGRSK